MSVIEARTITVYVAANVEKGRRRKRRHLKRLAYRDAAWAKIRARCRCTFPDRFEEERKLCRYHDKEYRASPSRWGGDSESPPDPPCFQPPEAWGLPRSDEAGYWDFGRAVAFRLARFYAHLDNRPGAPVAGAVSGQGGET